MTNGRVRLTGAVLLVIAGIAIPRTSQAADIQAWLNAPGWNLSYEVSFKSSTQGAIPVKVGTVTYTRNLERTFSTTLPLDMRSGGASLSMAKLTAALSDPAKAADPALQAEVTKLALQTDRMSWMNGGPQIADDASDAQRDAAMRAHIKAISAKAQLAYQEVIKSVNVVNELGDLYDQTLTTTYKGAGPVSPDETVMFEIDGAGMKYLLTLPFGFRDDSLTTVNQEIVTTSVMKGSAPTTERSTNQISLSLFPQGLGPDDLQAIVGQLLLFEGDVNPASGKITGERTIKGHFDLRGEKVPGTFTFRYTLTPR